MCREGAVERGGHVQRAGRAGDGSRRAWGLSGKRKRSAGEHRDCGCERDTGGGADRSADSPPGFEEGHGEERNRPERSKKRGCDRDQAPLRIPDMQGKPGAGEHSVGEREPEREVSERQHGSSEGYGEPGDR